jgi:hypothetical protein
VRQRRRGTIATLTLVLLSASVGLVIATTMGCVYRGTSSSTRVSARRGWQSTDVLVKRGDKVQIRARGTWLYTPGEYHGPQGHERYRAPECYPLPDVPGGALIGRTGKDGEPFYVGDSFTFRARRAGCLFLRIDDDVLSDNEGHMTVEVTIRPGRSED